MTMQRGSEGQPGAGEAAAAFRMGDTLGGEERASSRPVALVTGGSRDLGQAIVKKFLDNGVAVVTTSRTDRPKKEYQEWKTQIAEGGGILHAGDIKTPEVRQELLGHVDRLGGQLDFLVLSAADGTRALNVDTNLELMRMFLPKLKKGGAVVMIQSHMGHFYDVMDKGILFEEYTGVAESKSDEEKEGRREMAENPDAEGKQLLVIMGPTFKESTNVRLWNRVAKDKVGNLPIFAQNLGLPEFATFDELGDTVWDLLERRSELPNGYTETFSDTIDAREQLSEIYEPNAMYVHTMEADGTGHNIVTDSQIEEARLQLVDEVVGDTDHAATRFKIREEFTKGHFKVLPGHKGLAVAIGMERNRFEAVPENVGKTLELASADVVNFENFRVVGQIVDADVQRDFENGGDGSYRARFYSEGEQTMSMNGLRFRIVDKKDGVDGLQPNQLVEMAAQAVGLATGEFGKGGDAGKLPMFNEFKDAQFYTAPVKGEALTIKTNDVKIEVQRPEGAKRDMEVLTGSVDIYSGDILVAHIGSLKATMMVRRAFSMGIGAKLKAVEKRDAAEQAQQGGSQ